MTAQDAARAVRSLRTWPLLDGFRGQPRVDSAALEDLVVRLGRLAEDVPQVADVDLNPVLVGPDGCVARRRQGPARRRPAGGRRHPAPAAAYAVTRGACRVARRRRLAQGGSSRRPVTRSTTIRT